MRRTRKQIYKDLRARLLAHARSLDEQNTGPILYRSIPRFPLHRIGNDGSVWSFHFNHKREVFWRRVKGRIIKGGYRRVELSHSQSGAHRMALVHILVLEVFVGPCPRGLESCHNNGIPDDNRDKNLRWDTHLSNMRDRKKHQKWKQRFKKF